VTASLSAPLNGVSIADIGRAMLPGLVPALVMAIAVGLTGEAIAGHGLAAPIRLALLVALGALLYGTLLWLLEREALAEVTRLVLRRKPAGEASA